MIYLSIILCTINRLIPSTSSSELAGCSLNSLKIISSSFWKGAILLRKSHLEIHVKMDARLGPPFKKSKKNLSYALN